MGRGSLGRGSLGRGSLGRESVANQKSERRMEGRVEGDDTEEVVEEEGRSVDWLSLEAER